MLPSPTDRDDVPDDDPLSSFDSEVVPLAASDPPLSPSAPITATGIVTSPDSQVLVATLTAKLDEAAREIERSHGEVAALRAQLVTIVAKGRNIERQAGRGPKQMAPRQPVVPAREQHRFLKVVALAVLVLANAILWRPEVAPLSINRAQPVAEPAATTAVRVAPIADPVAAAPIADRVEPVSPLLGVPVAIAAPLARAAAPVAEPRPVPNRVRRVVAAESNEPREFLGILAVQTDPAGAALFVDRKPVGDTPLRLPALRAGAHLLWIERDGYQRWTRVVTVPADQITNVRVKLEPR